MLRKSLVLCGNSRAPVTYVNVHAAKITGVGANEGATFERADYLFNCFYIKIAPTLFRTCPLCFPSQFYYSRKVLKYVKALARLRGSTATLGLM